MFALFESALLLRAGVLFVWGLSKAAKRGRNSEDHA